MSVTHINASRLWERLEALAQFGQDPAGGMTRLAYTPADWQARDSVMQWMNEAGLSVRVDAIGNIFGRLEGRDASMGAVLLASHLDSVPQGGRFDGPLGVLSALEAVQTVVDEGLSVVHPVEVGVLVNEEGVRFGGLLGSRAVTQGVTPADVRSMVDEKGVSCYDALAEFGLDPERVGDAKRPATDFAAYVELHIEQASVLETEGLSVGVVTGIAGPEFLLVKLAGRADHAGATPMNLRRDALAGAAELVLAAERIATHEAGPNTVCTVGRIRVSPGATNVIPGLCEFSFDLRDVETSSRDRAEALLRQEFDRVCRERNLDGTWTVGSDVEPVRLDTAMVGAIGAACEKAGQRDFRLVSGAAHDAMHFVGICPVGMIFVRSQGGISHSPDEYTTPEDAGIGAEVMYHTLCELAVAR